MNTDKAQIPTYEAWTAKGIASGVCVCKNCYDRYCEFLARSARPQAQIAAVPAMSERDAFEAWNGGPALHGKTANGRYEWDATEHAWNIWQARAALSPPTAPITTLAEFCAEAKRTGLTVEKFAAALAQRPEFADCLPTAGCTRSHPHEDMSDACALRTEAARKDYIEATAPAAPMPSDEEILALNAGEQWFSESPSRYPESGHGTQYHGGAPGVIGIVREALALYGAPQAAPAPTGYVMVPVEPTRPMMDALHSSHSMPVCYRAMLAAAPQPAPADHFDGADKLVAPAQQASEPEPTAEPVALPFAIFADELAALHRFYETTEDGQDYDVPVSKMKRLAVIGLVRRVTANRYEFTDFGLSVRNGDFAASTPPLPQPSIPTGWKFVAVNEHFDDLLAALLRADSKGYMPDAMQKEWDEFDYDTTLIDRATPRKEAP